MTRPRLRKDQDGYGDRDRTYATNHDRRECNHPDTLLILSELVPPKMRGNEHFNNLICQLFHTEHYRNRLDPKKIVFRYLLANKLIEAHDRAEFKNFVEKTANLDELLSLESELTHLQRLVNSSFEMIARGKQRLEKEKADCSESA